MAESKKPLTLSIIIPAYNEERHLQACLESIADQTEKPDEVIVVDNNSTDHTARIARTFTFVRVVQEERQGIVYARNAGFNAATSTLIGRIDADSKLSKSWVKRVKQFYSAGPHQNHALTGGGYFYNVQFPPRVINGWILNQIMIRFNRFLLGHYILWGSNMAMTREQWLNVRQQVCDRNDIHEDLDLAIHLHLQGVEVTYRAKLKVGVAMKRVFDDRPMLRENMLWWPRTLQVHGNKRWVLGWLGAYGLYIGSFLLWVVNKPIQLLRS